MSIQDIINSIEKLENEIRIKLLNNIKNRKIGTYGIIELNKSIEKIMEVKDILEEVKEEIE